MSNTNILSIDKIFFTRLRHCGYWVINNFVRLRLFPSSFGWFRVAIKCRVFEF